MAAQMSKVSLEQVTPEQRKRAKTCAYAILYGAGPGKLTQAALRRRPSADGRAPTAGRLLSGVAA